MKSRFPLILLGCLVMAGCAHFTAGAPKGAINVIGHRGAAAYAPENTLASFKCAYEMGADWFELDCTLTKDGQVIVIHDDTLDRTTNGKGNVRDFTLAELKKLDAGSWKSPEFKGEPLPTLAEALDFARGRTGVYLEIKNAADDRLLNAQLIQVAGDRQRHSMRLLGEFMRAIEASGTRNLELTRKVVALVRERKMKREVVIQSFSPIVCAIVAAEAPEFRDEFLGSDDKKNPLNWESYVRFGNLIGVDAFNADAGSVTPERIAEFHGAGKTVHVWTVNKPDDVNRLASWRVDGIITDRPDMALRVLGRSHL